MNDSQNPSPRRLSDDPSDKMAQLEHEIEREDEREDLSKYAPKPFRPEQSDPGTRIDVDIRHAGNTEDELPSQPDAGEAAGIPSPPGEMEKPDNQPAGQKEVPETTSEPEPAGKAKSGSVFWNVAITVCFLLVVGMGVLYYQQIKQLPKDPLEEAMDRYHMAKDENYNVQLKHIEAKTRQTRNLLLAQRGDELRARKQEIDEREKRIEGLQREILGLRGQMKSYFALYKDFARKNARNLSFDSLTTVKTGKTYLNVTIQRVTDHSISIVHAGGAVNLDPSDISDALRERFAYGDPLELALMDQRQADEEKERSQVGKYLPELGDDPFQPTPRQRQEPRRVINDRAIEQSRFDPPADLPRVDAAPERGNDAAQRDAVLQDGWVPPKAPMPFDE